MVNDKQLEDYVDQSKKVCLAGICFFHSSIPFNLMNYEAIIKSGKYSKILLNYYYNGKSPKQFLQDYLTQLYVHDGSQYYFWDDSKWVPCS